MYEIATRTCVHVHRVADEIMDSAESPAQRLSAGRLALAALAQDVKTRIAYPRIRAMEAKLVESVEQQKIADRRASAAEPQI